jgi:hypothetical protein
MIPGGISRAAAFLPLLLQANHLLQARQGGPHVGAHRLVVPVVTLDDMLEELAGLDRVRFQ